MIETLIWFIFFMVIFSTAFTGLILFRLSFLAEEVERQREQYTLNQKEWLEERKDLYNRLMSKDLADYHHYSTDKDPKVKKPSNYLQQFREQAFRDME